MPRRRDEPVEPEGAPSEASAEQRPAKVRPQTKPIQEIETVGKAVVVQWMDEEDDYHKSTIPASEIKEGEAPVTALQAGEEAFTWEGAGLNPLWAKALRKARIFDPEDYTKNAYVAIKSIQGAIGKMLAKIVKENRHA
jgi:hypothetical protein